MSDPAPSDFSIVTTVYNGACYLERYLKTTRALADRTGAQIVIVDDGSTDGSGEILQNSAASGDQIKVIRMARLGRAAALNLGVEAADRPLVAIQDVDDVSLSNRLEVLTALIEHFPSATLFATGGVVVAESRLTAEEDFTQFVTTRGDPWIRREFDASDVFHRNFLIHSAVAFRRISWEAAGGYDVALKSCIDLDMYFRLLARGNGVIDSTPTVIFSHNPKSFFRSRSKSSYRKDLFTVLGKGLARNKIRFVDGLVGYARAISYTLPVL
jgi:glycosyltransferase involved in cell wall biosynthesis